MAGYKKYYGKNLGVRYFPDKNVIYLEPKKGMSKSELRQAKEKFGIYLQVDSSNFTTEDGKPGFTVKLSNQSQPQQVEELLRTMYHGGDEVETAASIAQDEEEEEQEEVPQQPPQDPSQQMQPQMQQPMESVDFLSAYDFLAESTYRTAEYWNVLSRASGKGKQAIDDKTILSLRRTFTKKPKGKRRDEVLRSLDSGMKYFARKLRNSMGDGAASQFKERYRSIGDLVPSDYSERKETDHVDARSAGPTPFDSANPAQQPEDSREDQEKLNLDFSEFFSDQEEEDEEDAYERYETED